MANRCNDCNKFVGLETQDPEVDSIEVDGEQVNVTVTITRACAECGTEMKTASLEFSDTFEGPDPEDAVKDKDAADDEKPEHDLEVEENGVEMIEEGGGRYAKSYYGATVEYTVTCSCGCGFEHSGSASDKIAASAMDDC